MSTRNGARQDRANQLRQLRAFCRRQRWTIISEYVDCASAKNGDRPQLKRMFADASQRRFDLLLFWSLDRLSREGVQGTLRYLETLTKGEADDGRAESPSSKLRRRTPFDRGSPNRIAADPTLSAEVGKGCTESKPPTGWAD